MFKKFPEPEAFFITVSHANQIIDLYDFDSVNEVLAQWKTYVEKTRQQYISYFSFPDPDIVQFFDDLLEALPKEGDSYEVGEGQPSKVKQKCMSNYASDFNVKVKEK